MMSDSWEDIWIKDGGELANMISGSSWEDVNVPAPLWIKDGDELKPDTEMIFDDAENLYMVEKEEDEEEDDEEEEDDDEDYCDLTEEAKGQLRILYLSNNSEPYGFWLFRLFQDKHPSKHPSYFNKVERHPDHDLFLQKLKHAQVPRSTHHTYPKHARDSLVKNVVASILWRRSKLNCKLWNRVHGMSHAANDGLYTRAIKAAASLVYLLHTKDSLFKIGCKRTLDKQMKELWDEIAVLGRQASPVYKVCEKIVQLTADKEKYSFVTEGDLAEMLSSYCEKVKSRNFRHPFIGQADFPEKDKDQIFLDIAKVVSEMGESSSPTWVVDAYTCMLVRFLRGPVVLEEEIQLLDDVIKIVDTTEVDPEKNRMHPVYSILASLLNGEKLRMKHQLSIVVEPLFILYNIHGCRYLSSEILDIVQVAELRRMALGSRFIGRSHLMWAFYECGYGLPKIRKTINLDSADEDHPPYHIYVAAMKLAESCGVKKMRLEHFIFAVLFSQDIVFDGSTELSIKMQQDFKDFMEDIALERTKMEPKTPEKSDAEDSSSDSRDTDESITNVEPPRLTALDIMAHLAWH